MAHLASRGGYVPPWQYSAKMPPPPVKMAPHGEPQSTMSYAKKLFSESTVSGISHIAQSDNYCRKLLWFVLFSFCLAGFLYQMGTFLMWYWAYPTAVDVQISNKGRLIFPSVTVCNSNRFRRTDFCRKFPDVCRKYPRMTSQQVADFQKEMLNKKVSKEERVAIGHELKEIVLYCLFTGIPALSGDNCTSRFEYYYDPGFGNCYSFVTSHTAGPELEALESDVWQTRSSLRLTLNLEANEYMDNEISPSLWVTLHVGNILPDTFSDTTQIDPGYSYTLSASKKTINQMKAPYSTNCTDYMELPWQRGKRQFTVRGCTAACAQNLQFRQCGFVVDHLSTFYDELPWDPAKVTQRQRICAERADASSKEYCRALCRVPCFDSYYDTSVESFDWPPESDFQGMEELGQWASHSYDEVKKNIALVDIFMPSMDQRIYTHVPKYMTLELFSYLGGYVGIWLGISLVAICELIEKIFMILTYRCRSRNNPQVQPAPWRSEPTSYPPGPWDYSPASRGTGQFRRRMIRRY